MNPFRLASVPRLACAALAVALALSPFVAPASATLAWGPRIGAGIDPDQFLLGAQFRPSAISRDLYIQPNVELGVGDHLTIVSFAMPLHYHFRTSTAAKPYAGGGFSVGLVNFDGDGRGEDFDDNEFEASIDLVGGVEWKLDNGNLFFMELLLGLGDLHDLELMTGLLF